MIINEYSSEIEQTVNLLKTIKDFEFTSINIYGSVNNPEIFRRGYSDIDIIFMKDNFDNLKLSLLADEISKLDVDFKEKRPTIMDDYLCRRIEFYIKYPNIAIDITIAPGLIPNTESLEKNAWYDNFEAIMGGVYVNSTGIYGSIPDYDRFKKEFYPFYSEELRTKRLDILANRLGQTNDLIETYIKDKNLNLTDNIYKIRKHFIQFLYIYYRKYFLSPEKHTYYQLTNILNLPEEEKEIICFLNGNLFNSAKDYIELSNYYINKYYDEKMILKRCK